MYGAAKIDTSCVGNYEKKAAKFRDLMWATPIFTTQRAEYERKANEWQKKADTARSKGCPSSLKTYTESSAQDVAAAAARMAAEAGVYTPEAGMSTGTKAILGLGAAIAVGGVIYALRSRKRA